MAVQFMDSNTFVGNLTDRQPWIVYDTVVVAQAATTGTQIEVFSVPIGAGATPKTKQLTNMRKPNQLTTADGNFLMFGLGFYFLPDTILADIILFLKNSYMEFKIDGKVYHEGTIDMFPSGYGLYGNSVRTGEGAWANGMPNLGNMRRFGKYTRMINKASQFFLTIYFPTAQTMTATASGGVGLKMICALDGCRDGLVQ